MKKAILSIIAISLFIMLIGFVPAPENGGAIWTTNEDCGTESQNVNHYGLGESVYINGAGFNEETYAWNITGQPGQASCDPDTSVATGNVVVNSSGAFCFEAYTVQADDCGEYKSNFNSKYDTYRVDQVPIVPEFGAVVGVLTVLGALGVFFVVRRK